MTELTPENTRLFLEEFSSFHDSVLRRIEISYEASMRREIRLCVEARRAGEDKNEGWVRVVLMVEGVADYRLTESARTSAQVLSDGLYLFWFGPVFAMEFGYLPSPPDTLDALKRSDFFITGKGLRWETKPYDSNW
jgi:hypothetical protein